MECVVRSYFARRWICWAAYPFDVVGVVNRSTKGTEQSACSEERHREQELVLSEHILIYLKHNTSPKDALLGLNRRPASSRPCVNSVEPIEVADVQSVSAVVAVVDVPDCRRCANLE